MGLDSIDYLATTFERSGWAPASARDRQIEDGSAYDKYFTRPTLSKECIKRNGSVEDTVAIMTRIIRSKYTQVEQLSKNELAVRGADGRLSIRATVENIFNFIFKYIKYNLEKGEQLKSPRRTWYSAQVLARQKADRNNSADCDCFSIFAGSCMYSLGIPFALRIAGYQGDGYQHVYCVAYDGGRSIICDPVTNRFDYEKPPLKSKTFPVNISNMGLNGTDIYVLDGIEGGDGLGKSDKKAAKKAAKAEKKQAKLEKKQEKKQAKLEKKAEKKEAKAEKKAEKKIAKAEKKAERLERKAEKKGGEKGERLRERAQATREAAQMKAEEIKEKAADKIADRQKNLDERFQKKEARIEKKAATTKEEKKEAKQKLKQLKKEIKQQKKEDGRGLIRKAAKGSKKVAMAPVRGAFLSLLKLNFRGMATGFSKNSQAYSKFLTKWKKIFGGSEAKFKAAITTGATHKALFGSSKAVKRAKEVAAEKGYDNIDNLGYIGALSGGEEVAMYMAIASAAISVAVGILKLCGVNVPEDFEDASKTMSDISQMVDPDASESDWEKRLRDIERDVNDINEMREEKEIPLPSDTSDTSKRRSEPSKISDMEEKEIKDAQDDKKDGSGNALKYGAIALGLGLLLFGGYKLLSGGESKASGKSDKLGLVPLS